jgi:hypothetical protein
VAALTAVALLLVLLCSSTLAYASAPTGARGEAAAPAIQPSAAPGELLTASQLDSLLTALPLEDLSSAQLAHFLAGFDGIDALGALPSGLLGETQLGAAGLEQALREAVEGLDPGAPLGALSNPTELLPEVEDKLDNLLLTLGPALGSSQQELLANALGSLDLDQLVSRLLATAHERAQLEDIANLMNTLFGELGAPSVEELLGSQLSEPLAPTTVADVAEELATSPQAINQALGQTVEELPATTPMLTAPVTRGKMLAVAPAAKGLAVGLLEDARETAAEEPAGGGEDAGGEETGGEQGSGTGANGDGSSGGNAGGSSAGTAGGARGAGSGSGGVTIVVNVPSAPRASSTPATAAVNPGAVRISRVRIHGTRATVTLQTPAAGRVQLIGRGLRAHAVKVHRARSLTVQVRLSRAGAASLRRHRGRPLAITLRVVFRPVSGARSTIDAKLKFR